MAVLKKGIKGSRFRMLEHHNTPPSLSSIRPHYSNIYIHITATYHFKMPFEYSGLAFHKPLTTKRFNYVVSEFDKVEQQVMAL